MAARNHYWDRSIAEALACGHRRIGAIGYSLAETLDGLGSTVRWWGPRAKPTAKWPFVSSLIELARESDVLVICARADAVNRSLISKNVIEALGPDGLLVNVSRGQLVDEDALIEALRTGRLGGAALDVFEVEPTPFSRWKDVPNVLLTPHIGGSSVESTSGMTDMLMDNLASFFSDRTLVTPVPAGQST